METDEEVSRVNDVLAAICEEMFPRMASQIGVDVPREVPAAAVLATIGLGADDLRGVLTIMAGPGFFRATYPMATSPAPAEPEILDWAGELANQTLGRLNSRLAALGCLFSLGIPAVVTGEGLRIEIRDDRRYASLRGRLGDDEALVVFQIQRTAGGPLFRSDALTTSVGAGEGILF